MHNVYWINVLMESVPVCAYVLFTKQFSLKFDIEVVCIEGGKKNVISVCSYGVKALLTWLMEAGNFITGRRLLYQPLCIHLTLNIFYRQFLILHWELRGVISSVAVGLCLS